MEKSMDHYWTYPMDLNWPLLVPIIKYLLLLDLTNRFAVWLSA